VPDLGGPIAFPLTEVRRLTGLEAPEDETRRILSALGFSVEGSGPVVEVMPPSWRPDVEGKADLVEEVMRIAGVDAIPVTPFPREPHVPSAVLTVLQKRTRLAKRTLAARGMMEAVTWSFVSRRQAQAFGGGQAALALANPIAADLSDMRPSLLPGLVAAAQRNADRGHPDIALFEVGQLFLGDRPEDQRIAASGLRRGQSRSTGLGRHWSSPPAGPSVFDAKEDATALLGTLGVPIDKVQVVAGGPAWYHPGRSGTLQLGPQTVLGTFGELHPRVLELLEAEGPVAAFEIILDALPTPKVRPTRSKGRLAISAFQPVRRDFAFLVDRSVPAGEIVRAAQGVDRRLVASVSVFDVYEGQGIGADKKSVAIEVVLQPQDKTLTDAEIEGIGAKIVSAVTKKTAAVLRG
jgi:phenylalanyl-tRNA synthetase beta chain